MTDIDSPRPPNPEKDGLDLDALRALAEKATPGPWWQNAEWPGDVEAASHCIVDDSKEEADAAFIAAFSPQTALSLVAELTWYREHHVEQECEITRLRSELAALRESRDNDDEKLRASRSVNPSGLPDDELEDDANAHHWRVLRPPGIHLETYRLVVRFANALAAKLRRAEEKYGYDDGWRKPGWMDTCRTRLREHIEKGDPLDVAAYCAFLWHHDESTTAEPDGAAQPRSISNNDATSQPSNVEENAHGD